MPDAHPALQLDSLYKRRTRRRVIYRCVSRHDHSVHGPPDWFGEDDLLLDNPAPYTHTFDDTDLRAPAEGAEEIRRHRAAAFTCLASSQPYPHVFRCIRTSS